MKRAFASLDLEERILNGAALFALLSVFFPWLSGEWPGGELDSYSGFSFYTSFIGWIIFLLLLTLISVTFSPMLGGPVLIRRKHKEITRLCIAAQTTILSIAALSVLMKVTYEFAHVEIRFGMYFVLIGSIVTTIYCFLKWQEELQNAQQDTFHHPEDSAPLSERTETMLEPPPPPPPPPPHAPEEHHFRG